MPGRRLPIGATVLVAALNLLPWATAIGAQDRLSTMPGYDQFSRMQEQLRAEPAFVSGGLDVDWADDSRSLSYAYGGRMYRFDVPTGQAVVTGDAPAAGRGRGGRAGGLPAVGRGRGGRSATLPGGLPNPCPAEQVERGRQATCAPAPDGSLIAIHRDRNLFVARADGTAEVAVTTDGSVERRIKYGIGSWVYGEELRQTSAIWWSPDASKVAFYRFDESPVKDFYLPLGLTAIQSQLDVEAYPKAGAANPIADVLVYDVASRRTTKIDVRSGREFTNDVVGHYVYNIRWSPDGSELLMNRTNRRQQIVEFIGCAPSVGACRVIVREVWPTGWSAHSPGQTYLRDNRRFIWESERNGWRNYYLYDLSGRLINPITAHTTFEASSIVRVDEAAGVLLYMARDGDNHMKMQLRRVGLDGRGDVRLTDPAFHHSVSLSSDGKLFVDVYQTHNQPPATRLVDATSGRVVAELAKSDLSRFEALGLKRVEQFTYKAADGVTTLYGTIAFPSSFNASRKYPALVPVYGGPASGSNVPNENFAQPNPNTEYGFLVVNLSSRAAPGIGKRMLDAIYMKLGETEMADMAEGVKALWSRPYFDKERVGIYGTSYGGYASALSILKYPDVYTAASASSPVTSWHHYDSIYTERYMWIPEENEAGYEAGNAMNYAKNLRGRLLIYYGTADNNVHPNNSLQLVRALQQAGKSFEVQVGPDAGHTSVNQQRMLEFFIENLVQRPERLLVK